MVMQTRMNSNHLNGLSLPLMLSLLVSFAVSGSVFCSSATAQESPEVTRGEGLFVHRVLPLLKEKCNSCHGDDADDLRGELDTRSLRGILKGGESGTPSLIEKNASKSPLFRAVLRTDDEFSPMPPKENDQLSKEQIQYFKEWINGGAPWPSADRIEEIRRATDDEWNSANGNRVMTSGGLADDWTNRRYKPDQLWAYRPAFEAKRVADLDEADVIDTFLNERMKEMEISPAPAADRRTLIRRATYDLTGLPPTLADIQSFVNDPLPDEQAFAKVVDRLLDSPHYGEKWAQHWLDVVRYADSSGFANDFERGNAWRYRDYVVRAFNDDKPYDQFIREQIAGDEIDATNPELLVAAGFLRMGPWELTGMEVEKVARHRFLDDVTDAVGQVFLGHMLQCARCHDHKFDPIPTRDYYSMQAAFATTQLTEREAPFLDSENRAFHNEQDALDIEREHYNSILKTVSQKITIDAARKWFVDNGRDAEPFEMTLSALQKKSDNGAVDVGRVRKKMQADKIDPALIPPGKVGFSPRDFGLERIGRKGLARLGWRAERYKPFALSVYSGPTPTLKSVAKPIRMPANPMKQGEIEATHILTGGDPFANGEPVSPGVISAVSLWDGTDHEDHEAALPSEVSGRRRALADWIANGENPLTSRVMANRIWQGHFGKAIAGNPNNFGATGQRPTHPELLDWLAVTFVKKKWSVKDMHRLIMNTNAYRRSPKHPSPETLASNDPNNISYAAFHPRRLTAEEIRDTMLMTSGELNRELGGIPIRPEMNLEAALQPRMVMGTFAEAWQPSALPQQRHRRSIYALKLRGLRDPFFEVLNSPTPDLSCESRDASTVTPQVFAMFNSEASYNRAIAMAVRIVGELQAVEKSNIAGVNAAAKKVDHGAAIKRAFELAYGRTATDDESELCNQHLQNMIRRHESISFKKTPYPKSVVREAVEENTGENFTFEEPLHVSGIFVADVQPADVNAEVRGLAEVCLVLMNANEFVYIY